MKLSKSLLAIPVASFLFAVAVGSGACSSSITLVTPGASDFETPPDGVVGVDGYTFGDPCTGDVYYADGDAWEVCYGGVWSYTTTDPDTFEGYSEGTDTGDDDATGDDTGGGSDDTGSDDTGGGSDDTGDDDATGDDTGSGSDDTGSDDDSGSGSDDAGSDDSGS